MENAFRFLDRLNDYLSGTFGGIELWRLVCVALIILASFTMRRMTASLIKGILAAFVRKTKTKFDDYLLASLDKPLQLLVIVAGFHLCVVFIPWANWLHVLEDGIAVPNTGAILAMKARFTCVFAILYTVVGATFLWAFTDKMSAYFIEVIKDRNLNIDATLVVTTRKFVKIIIVIFTAAMVLDRLGQDVTMIIASFAVATAAIAFAARDSIANVFGAIVLTLDRPFSIGDWIVVDGQEGTVEEIGIRSSKIRTFAKSVLHIPNNQLMNLTIENMSSRPRQRIKSFFGITYDSPPEKVEALIEGIKAIIIDNPHTFKDYYQIWFTAFDDSSLRIMLYFYIESKEWAVFLEQRQVIYLEIMKLLKKLNLEFAFPTQTIFLEQENK